MATATASPAQQLAAFDAAATERSISMASVAYGNGAATFNLPHAGVPTYLIIGFNGSLKRTDGTTVGGVTASPFWPFNLMAPSSLIDYSGITRVWADGYDLYTLLLMKAFGSYQKTLYSAESYANTIYTASIPTGAAGASKTSTLIFSMVLPVSLSKWSALGSYDATVPNGEAQLTINEAPVTGSYVNSPLTLTGKTTVSITGNWSVGYYFLDAPSSVAIPTAALSQVHEIYHQASNTDLAAGSNKDVVLQTGRTYQRLMQFVVENNAASLSHVANVQFLVDSATPTLNETLAQYYQRTRMMFGRDFAPGAVLRDFSRKPWTPNSYGSLTARLVLNNSWASGAYSNVTTTRETLYVPSGNLVQIGG